METSTINTSSRWTIEATLQESGAIELASVFNQVANKAEEVNRRLADLSHIVAKNQSEFENFANCFYGSSTVSNAANFEQAYASYQAYEMTFFGLCRVSGVDDAIALEMVRVARQGK